MMVFERSNGILFSCDAFGGYGAVASDKSFDDTLDEATVQEYIDEAIRYYANIVAAFSPFVTRAINQLAHLPIKIIAPSHGLIWRKDVARIVNLYSTLAGYATNAGDPKRSPSFGEACMATPSALLPLFVRLSRIQASNF